MLFFSSCGNNESSEPSNVQDTIKKIQNEYSVIIEGDTFDSNTILNFENKIDDEEIKASVENMLENQEYNNDADSIKWTSVYYPSYNFIQFKETGIYATFITKYTHVIRVVKMV